MANIAVKFGLGTSLGINFSNPKQFIVSNKPAAQVRIIDTSTTATTSGSAGFWTSVGNDGVAVDSNFTAATYKQILSITGDGEVGFVIGPTAGGSETTTFEITVDGTLKEIAVSVSSGERAILAASFIQNDTYTTSSAFAGRIGDLNAAKTQYGTAVGRDIVSTGALASRGIPRLQFDTSLLVRIKHSANVTGTGSNERQSGVGYREYL